MKKVITIMVMVATICAMMMSANAATLYNATTVTFDGEINLTEGAIEFARDGVDLSIVFTRVPEIDGYVRMLVRYEDNFWNNYNEGYLIHYDEFGHVLDEMSGNINETINITCKEDFENDYVISQMFDVFTSDPEFSESIMYVENVEEVLAE